MSISRTLSSLAARVKRETWKWIHTPYHGAFEKWIDFFLLGTEFFLRKTGVQVVTLVMSVEMWLVVLMVPASISEVDLPDMSSQHVCFSLIAGARSGWHTLGA